MLPSGGNMILDQIVKNKRKEVEAGKKALPLAGILPQLKSSERSFKGAISGQRGKEKSLSIIAEIKKSSPSGLIRKNFDIPDIISRYDKHPSVRAISVLTDKKYFGMEPSALPQIRKLTNKPLLRKEFIIDEYQVYESRLLGADAILLIARLLTNVQIDKFILIAREFHMDCIVEVHTAQELSRVLKTNTEIIGINNRNLDTLKTDIATTKRLAELVPKGKVIVAESGYETNDDIQKLPKKVDAVLVGTALLKENDIYKKISQLVANNS